MMWTNDVWSNCKLIIHDFIKIKLDFFDSFFPFFSLLSKRLSITLTPSLSLLNFNEEKLFCRETRVRLIEWAESRRLVRSLHKQMNSLQIFLALEIVAQLALDR